MFYGSKENLKKIKNRIAEYNLYLIAHNVSGFDSYVVLNNLPQWRNVGKLIRTGAGLISLEIFKRCVDETREVPQ